MLRDHTRKKPTTPTHPRVSFPPLPTCSQAHQLRLRQSVQMQTISLLMSLRRQFSLFFYFPEPQLIWLQLLRPEVERFAPWWAYVGAVCGGGIGFIVANVPGLMLGAYAGNRLGAIRDAKGKSVAAVFTQLGGNQKAEASQTSRRVFRLLILKSHPTRFCARWL
jgi:hypothetical protein